LYAKPEATGDEIEGAAQAAFSHARILELPDGYDVKVGEGGLSAFGR
jgi:ATP-binding cassette subfamily B protein